MNKTISMLAFRAAPGAALMTASSAYASFLPPELMDAAANGLALFVLFAMPIAGIVVFWLVHILPEKVAEKRHHPQKTAITTLCLLSLAFGGLLWPIAWLWAYSRPVAFRMAYGTDKHEDYFREVVHQAKSGGVSREELLRLKAELDEIAARRMLTAELMKVRDDMAAVLADAAQPAARES
jgi:CBS domain containing-hemolysin-like protein